MGINSENELRRGNPQSALVALICLMAFGVTFVLYTASYLPDRVATHFGADGRANGWMTRTVYVWFTLGFLIGLPVLLSVLVDRLPRRLPSWTNIPNREYWLSPERREKSLGFLASQGHRLSCLIVMLTMGLHYLILVANQRSPQILPMSNFLSMLGAFLILLLIWVVRVYRRFPKPQKV